MYIFKKIEPYILFLGHTYVNSPYLAEDKMLSWRWDNFMKLLFFLAEDGKILAEDFALAEDLSWTLI